MAVSPRHSVLLVEPWFAGSHRSWAEGFRRHSRHRVSLLTEEPRGWRDALQEGASRLALKVTEVPDLVVASSMLDAKTFMRSAGLRATPTLVYMHENQLTYDPGRPNRTFGMINWNSAAAADRVAFNSGFHLEDFYTAAAVLDLEPGAIQSARSRSVVLPVGLELDERPPRPRNRAATVVLWNHRWQHDKAPEEFVAALSEVKHLPIELILAGEQTTDNRFVARLRAMFGPRVIHAGFASSLDYRRLLPMADIVVSTARQEFFGVAVAEAMGAGVVPLVPERLAYPELIPQELHATCLYREGELPDRLAALVTSVGELEPVRRMVAVTAAKYAWPQVIEHYDLLVDSLAAEAA